ncbi:MAG: hypothetical protein JXA52_00555 [Planctomycetes bacterium]|nr:hypothetical protein [Planctomycetota bacterium]
MTLSSPAHNLKLNRKLHGLYWALTGSILGVFSLIFWWFPEMRDHFLQEDCFLENLSALFFLLAFMIGLAAILKPACRRLMPLVAWLIPVLGLLGFLDETSFLGLLGGADNPSASHPVYDTSPLVLPGGYEIDGVHDLFTLAFKLLNDAGLSMIQIAVLVAAVVGLPLILTRKFYMPWIMKHCRQYPAFNFLRYAFIFIVIAQLFDLKIVDNPAIFFGEELFEGIGGFTLVFATLAMWLGIYNEEPRPIFEKESSQ